MASATTELSPYWKQRKRPLRMECRYLFDDYDSLRDFLDQAADLSEADGYYHDMGFGRDYVNITIHADEGSNDDSEGGAAAAISPAQQAFARSLDRLYAPFEPAKD